MGFKSRRDDRAEKKMALGKSPAQEGLRTDFYQCFWDIRELLFEALEKVYGNTHVTMKQGVNTLIPKPNRDRAIIDHLRSIALFIIDSKISTHALATWDYELSAMVFYFLHSKCNKFWEY